MLETPFLLNSIVLVGYITALLLEIADPIALLVTCTIISVQVSGYADHRHISTVLHAMAHPVLYLLVALSLFSRLFSHSRTSRTLQIPQTSNFIRVLIGIIVITLFFSSFLNNALIVSTMIPLIQTYTSQCGIRSGPLLLALSFSSMLAGTVTLLGSSTNLIAASLLEPEISLHLTSMTVPSILTALLSSIYLLVVIPIYSKWANIGRCIGGVPELRIDLLCLEVTPESVCIGNTVRDASFQEMGGAQLCGIQRGKTFIVHPPRSFTTIHGGDRLIYVRTGPSTELESSLLIERGLITLPLDTISHLPNIAYGTIPKYMAYLNGKTVAEVGLKQNHGLIVLALLRGGSLIQTGISTVRMQKGDLMIVYGIHRPESLTKHLEKFCRGVHVLASSSRQPPQEVTYKTDLLLVIILASLIVSEQVPALDIHLTSLFIILVIHVTQLLGATGVHDAITDYKGVLIGTVASLGLSASLNATGFSRILSPYVEHLTTLSPWKMTMCFHMISSMCSLLFSNAAVVSILIPLLKLVLSNDIPLLRTVSIAVIHGASCCFASPTGYHTNLMIYHIGGLRCRDFLLVGLPLHIITSCVFASMVQSV